MRPADERDPDDQFDLNAAGLKTFQQLQRSRDGWTETHVGGAVDLECGHRTWPQGDLLPAAVETVLGEMGRTDGGAEPRVPAAPTRRLDPQGKKRVVVQGEPVPSAQESRFNW